MPVDLRPDHLATVREILRRHVPDRGVWAFGSRIRGTAHIASDLDLCIRGDDPLGFERLGRLRDAFSASALPFRVDVVDWASTAESFRKVIEKERVVVQKMAVENVNRWNDYRLGEVFAVNPRRAIKRGTITPFIPMDALPTNARTADRIDTRLFSGSGSKFQNGDTLLARITPCLENGKTAFVSGLPDNVVAHGSTEYIVLSGLHDLSYDLFAYYLARSPDFRAYAIAHMEGTSGRQRVPHEAVSRYLAFLPAYTEQQAIATVLGALDDRIELNRRTNETLEAMARALFKDWFVDFGPIRAKAEGRPAYLAPDIWSLFPDALDDEDKPAGWCTEFIFQQANWINGAAFKGQHFTDDPDALPVIKIAELKNGVTKNTKFSKRELDKRYMINRGELLFSWSGNPDTSIDTFVWPYGEAWLNQHIFAVRENGVRSICFLYSMLKWLKPEFAELARNKQTTGLGHVTQQDLKRMMLSIPTSDIEKAFEDLVSPLFVQYCQNLYESQTLAQLRDMLLPKLITGEIRVRDAEKAVGAVL